MSVHALTWAFDQQVVTDPAARLVLICLANWPGEGGKGAFPSNATLCRMSGLSERTVRVKLAELTLAGLISLGDQALAAHHIKRADRRPTVYDLHLERGAAFAPRGEKKATGGNLRRNGGQSTPERGAAVAPEPRALTVIEPKEKPVDKNRRREAEGRALASIRDLLTGATP